jgi:hypothetical protein
MAKLTETERKRLSNYYNEVLFNLFTTDQINEEEMDIIINDIDTLTNLAETKTWTDLNFYVKRFSLSNDEVLKLLDSTLQSLVSPLLKRWVKIHIENNHFPILYKNLKDSEKYVVKFYFDIPEFIEITEARKQKMTSMVRKFYQEKILDEKKNKFIKVYINSLPIPKEKEEMVKDEKFKIIACALFDYEINLLEKNLFQN